MRVSLLDALPPNVISGTLEEVLRGAGVLAAHHRLRDERFTPCRGCFECWVEHPGTCTAKDAANEVMRDVIGSDVAMWTTRVRFGCWDAVTKAALDKSIGLLSPFFMSVQGETHHRPRYRRYPRWGVLAVVAPETGEDEREAFRRLVARNALNMQSRAPWVGFVPEGAGPTTVRAVVAEGLAALAEPPGGGVPRIGPFPPREDARGVAAVPDRPRRALLWVGSARPAGTSTSEALGGYLLQRLGDAGWSTEVLRVTKTVRLGRAATSGSIDAFRRADLVVAAAPVYIDCLPALVLTGLDQLVRARLGADAPVLLPIVQCGFPEVEHTTLALEVFARAAARAGMGWAGHLALGGGGTIDGRELVGLGGRVRHQVAALDLAAEALDRGEPVPREAIVGFARTALPAALYRLAGNAGWLALAHRNRALRKLWHRPFAEV